MALKLQWKKKEKKNPGNRWVIMIIGTYIRTDGRGPAFPSNIYHAE
jgi:hypothetical protein